MTYDEIKQRLTKCEVKLQEFQSKNHPARKSKNYDTAVEKLTLLKESLQKQLKEAEETMVVKTKGGDTEIVGMDRKQAQSLKTDPSVTSIKTSKGQKIKEQDGVQFSKEETAAIAKEVGKAVAKALHNLGDEVAHMKAKDLEPNSFEIYVQYKNDSDDQFSFYISDDTLHLQDFSFDKEIGSVGVKPSGEAIVHVDVLANELVKHFKSLAAEGMSDQEFADAQEADRLEKHPEKDTIKKIQALIAAQQKSEATKEEEEEYHKKLDTLTHKTFGKREDELEEDINLHKIEVSIRDAKKAQDIMYDMYDHQFEQNGSNVYLFDDEQTAYDAMMDLAARGIEIENIEDFDEEGLEEYKSDYAKRRESEKDYNPKKYRQPKNDYFARRKKESDNLEEGEEQYHIYGRPVQVNKGENSNGTDWTVTFLTDTDMAKKGKTVPLHAVLALIEPKPEVTAHEGVGEEETDNDTPAIDRMYNSDAWVKAQQDAQENKAEDTEGGDLDVGHQDDEPDMLKQQVYDIATYAAKLYKALDKYDQMDAEVDFPNWWQSKVILARDYISAAQHYLEFEEKQPAIDALALEEGADRASYNKLKKEYDALVGKMKQLAVHFKTAEGEKKAKIVAALKQHTARKRELEALIDQTVSGVGVGQELDPSVDELFGPKLNYDEIIGGIITRFNELKKYVSKKEPDAMDDLQKVLRAFEIFDEKMAYGAHEELEEINEAKATCCGKCGRVHVKGTECKKPYLKGKDHCRYN